MPRDSAYSYLQMSEPHHVLFKETWQKDVLAFDDVDLPAGANNLSLDSKDNLLKQFLSGTEEVENDLTIINGSNPMFNSSYANRMKQKSRNLNWKDLGLREFLGQREHIDDRTILKRPRFGDADEAYSADEGEEVRASEQIFDPHSSFEVLEGDVTTANFEETIVGQQTGAAGASLVTPVVNSRMSQNLESMTTFSSRLKRQHSERRFSSRSDEEPESHHARIIR